MIDRALLAHAGHRAFVTRDKRTFRAAVIRCNGDGTRASVTVILDGVRPRSEAKGETELQAVEAAMEYLMPSGAKLGKVKESTC